MEKGEVDKALKEGLKKGCKEALFTFGERPEGYKKMRDFLEMRGYENFLEYLYDLCERAIDLGLLPHTNAGILGKGELRYLKDVNISMGLMLENASERLCEEGEAHEHSPGKSPKLRLEMIENAGKLKIPFTTGLLIGIGETNEEIIDSLLALKRIQQKYGHIQEIIVQNFVPKPGTPMENEPGPSLEKMIKATVATRLLFEDMSIQVPPNLNPGREEVFLKCGANDFGGVSPVTFDYINPESHWPEIGYLSSKVRGSGFELRERLAIYPRFVKKGWYTERLKSLVDEYADSEGLVREAC